MNGNNTQSHLFHILYAYITKTKTLQQSKMKRNKTNGNRKQNNQKQQQQQQQQKFVRNWKMRRNKFKCSVQWQRVNGFRAYAIHLEKSHAFQIAMIFVISHCIRVTVVVVAFGLSFADHVFISIYCIFNGMYLMFQSIENSVSSAHLQTATLSHSLLLALFAYMHANGQISCSL